MRREWTIAVVALLAVLHLGFYRIIWGGVTLVQAARAVPSITPRGAAAGPPAPLRVYQVLDPGSSGWQSEPWTVFIGEQFAKRHALPLWNPYQGFGKPLAANMQSQPFYPLTALLSLWVTTRNFNWYFVLRLLAAGICGFGFFRKLVSFWPALGGAAACMLAGYLVFFINQPHISVEVLFPAILWAIECLVEKPNYRSMTVFAVTILLVLVGGMPESSFLLLAFVYIYLAVRIFTTHGRRGLRSKQIRYAAGATVAGLGLSAFQVMPFLEFVRLSMSGHQAWMTRGLEHIPFDAGILGGLTPLAFGAPASTTNGVTNYFGVIAFFLILMAAAGSWPRRSQETDVLTPITWFAWSAALFVWLKRYGAPLINQVGVLPVFRQIDMTKYEEPMLSFAIAILVAIGIERLLQGRVPAKVRWAGWLLVSGLVALTWFVSPQLNDKVFAIAPHSKPYAIILAAILLLLLAILLYVRKFILVAALVAIELVFCFIMPAYKFYGSPARRAADPYKGAPYIDYLKQHAGNERIFAENGLLSPSWASAFDLFDIRDLDALYFERYFRFLSIFFGDTQYESPELKSCFRGWPIFQFKTPLEKRLLQLASIRYVASYATLPSENRGVEEILSQNKSATLMHDGRVDDNYTEVLMQHPPSQRLPYKVRVPYGPAIFHYAYGMSQASWNMAGDGVGFTLEIRTPRGEIRKIFQNYIDPKHNSADQKWIHGTVDLSEFRGKDVTFLFSTDPGPAGNTLADWAGWGDLGFEEVNPLNLFHVVYQADTLVFRYDNILPRVGIFHHADLVTGEEAVRRRIAHPEWDLFQSVVVDQSELDTATRQQLEALNKNPSTPVESAQRVSFDAQQVRIETTLSKPGILMLNDTDYPGWTVSVDGNDGTWFPVDYLFRGVFLGAGEHRVVFSYQPSSFMFGTIVSTFSAALLAITAFTRRLAGQI